MTASARHSRRQGGALGRLGRSWTGPPTCDRWASIHSLTSLPAERTGPGARPRPGKRQGPGAFESVPCETPRGVPPAEHLGPCRKSLEPSLVPQLFPEASATPSLGTTYRRAQDIKSHKSRKERTQALLPGYSISGHPLNGSAAVAVGLAKYKILSSP